MDCPIIAKEAIRAMTKLVASLWCIRYRFLNKNPKKYRQEK
jgi:hypothetical protein